MKLATEMCPLRQIVALVMGASMSLRVDGGDAKKSEPRFATVTPVTSNMLTLFPVEKPLSTGITWHDAFRYRERLLGFG